MPINVLLVEDNPGDRRLVLECLKEAGDNTALTAVADGVEAMDFLRRKGCYAGAARPDVIFLDLGLPRKDGHQVLAEIKAAPELKGIPVVVVTGSSADEDVSRAYDLHANCYATKPIALEQFAVVMKAIESFWLGIVTLPPK